MADLIRRKNDPNLPSQQQREQAQRVVDALEKIASGANQPPAPAGQAHPPHQTVIYIQAPPHAAQQQPPMQVAPPQQPPVEVHHHHTTVQESPRRRGRGMGREKSTSALGVAALALGIIACVVCWVPLLGLAAVPIGAIGFALGLLGLLIAMLGGRSGPGLPFAAMFVCALAMGISVYLTGWLAQHWKEYAPAAATAAGGAAPTKSSPGAGSASGAGGGAVIKAAPETPHKPSSIFDFGSEPATGAKPGAVTAAPSGDAAGSTASPSDNVAKATAAVKAAKAKLDAAHESVAKSLANDPAYRVAKDRADQAEAARKAALAKYGSGSPEVIDASQEWIAAKNAVNQMETRAGGTNLQIAAAEEELRQAEQQLRQAEQQAKPSTPTNPPKPAPKPAAHK